MPYFETYTEVEVQVDEFLSSCREREIRERIYILLFRVKINKSKKRLLRLSLSFLKDYFKEQYV